MVEFEMEYIKSRPSEFIAAKYRIASESASESPTGSTDQAIHKTRELLSFLLSMEPFSVVDSRS